MLDTMADLKTGNQDARYKACIWYFSDKEINQIVDLAERWVSADTFVPIDKRHYTKLVMKYAQEDASLTERREDGRTYISRNARGFDYEYNLPPEALWRLFVKHIFRPTGEYSQGGSISKSAGWLELNIYPHGHRFHTDKDLESMQRILIRLQQWHYVIFQNAGSIWLITQLEGRGLT